MVDLFDSEIVKSKLKYSISAMMHNSIHHLILVLAEYLESMVKGFGSYHLSRHYIEFCDATFDDIAKITLPSIEESLKEAELKEGVRKVEINCLKFGNLAYIKEILVKEKDFYLEILEDEMISNLCSSIDRFTKMGQDKIPILFWSSLTEKIISHHLYFDYGSNRNYNSLKSKRSDLTKIFDLVESLVASEYRKPIIDRLTAFIFSGTLFSLMLKMPVLK